MWANFSQPKPFLKTAPARLRWSPAPATNLRKATAKRARAHLYQRDKWGRVDRETALIELSPAAFESIAFDGDRGRYESERIGVIRSNLEDEHAKPIFAVFYGVKYRRQYQEVAGGPFEDGFRWNGSTLCALITHPSRPTRTYAYWTEYGRRLRQIVDSSRSEILG
jgi:hypothetical protein